MAEKSEIGVAPATLAEFQNFMEGSQTMDGGRHDLDSRGMTSDDPMMRREARPDPPPEEAPFVQQPQPQGQNWQALYGREANEKGQWRRTAEEALAQLEALKGQFSAPLNAPVYNASAPPQNGGYSTVPAAIQPTPPAPPIPDRFLPERDLGDSILVEDVERILKEMVAPEIWSLRAQNQSLQQMQLQSIKGSSGIAPHIEGQLVQSHPWLNNISDPFARITAMRELVTAHNAMNAPAPVQQPAPAATSGTSAQGGNAAVRRVTMVETMNPRINDADMSTQDLFKQEMGVAMQKPFGAERTSAMREVFNKYGIYNQNDWGPDVLPR